MKKYIKILFLLLAFHCKSTFIFAAEPAIAKPVENEQKVNTFFKELCDFNMGSFEKEDTSWSANTAEAYFKGVLKERLNPQPGQRRSLAFSFFREIEKTEKNKNKTNPGEVAGWKDLNLFCGQSDRKKYIANTLKRTSTEIGTISFYQLLAQPICDHKKLIMRQEIIKTLLNDKVIFNGLNKNFSNIEKPESVLLSFFDNDHFYNNVKDSFGFSIPLVKGILNKSDTAILLKSLSAHSALAIQTFTTIIACAALVSYAVLYATNVSIIPDEVKKFFRIGEEKEYWGTMGPLLGWLCRINNRWLHTMILSLGGICCASMVHSSIKWSRTLLLFERTIHALTIPLAKFFNACKNVFNLIKANPKLYSFEEFKDFISFFDVELKKSSELQDFFNLSESMTFKTEPSLIFAHKGKMVRLYILMHKLKEKLQKMILGFARIDAYMSLAKLKSANEKVNFSFAKFAEAERPFIKIKNFWHPFIDREKVITNSITLGDTANSNIVLTGPNAGGKSIALKSIVLSVWLAHTIGIVPAEEMTLTPFKSISTYLNITDDSAAGQSLFKAEVLRCQNLITKIEKSGKNDFHLQVFDEVFNGTTPKEGMAAAYGVAEYLGKFKNSISLIATHFPELTKLEKDAKTFDNYKVSVNYMKDGSIEYPYKLEKGIANQYVAFDILKAQGFSGEIIEKAKRIVEKQRNNREFT